MSIETDKIMFMIYKDTTYSDKFRVCYFTELNEHNKDSEINKAFAGEHFYNGYIRYLKKERAKEIIAALLDRLNSGENVTPEEVDRALAEFVVR